MVARSSAGSPANIIISRFQFEALVLAGTGFVAVVAVI